MRAIQVTTYVASASSFTVTTVPTPQSSPDKYLIRIHACGTNFFDLLQIQG
jgi:NADPH:quinone reductase